MYQGACLVHAYSQLALYNQQQSRTLNVEHSSPLTHATKATAHTARTWPRTTVICNGHAATDPQYTYSYPYYAHTIYVPPTYPWSVSTRLVLTWLPVPSPSKTEDHNANALQLFSECHLRLHYICTANLCMVGLNKACTNAFARSKPVDDRGSKTHLHYNYVLNATSRYEALHCYHFAFLFKSLSFHLRNTLDSF